MRGHHGSSGVCFSCSMLCLCVFRCAFAPLRVCVVQGVSHTIARVPYTFTRVQSTRSRVQRTRTQPRTHKHRTSEQAHFYEHQGVFEPELVAVASTARISGRQHTLWRWSRTTMRKMKTILRRTTCARGGNSLGVVNPRLIVNQSPAPLNMQRMIKYGNSGPWPCET